MTPAEKLGFVEGGVYTVKEGNAFLGIKTGDKLMLITDDGGVFPFFSPNARGDRISTTLDRFVPPDVIRINKRRVPKPQQEALENGTKYYIPLLTGSRCMEATWKGDYFDLDCLKNGMVHLIERAAKLHSKALRSFTRTKKGE